MKLEQIARCFSPQNARPDGVPSVPSGINLKKNELLATLSYLDNKSIFGVELFLSKINIIPPEKALKKLYAVAIMNTDKYPIFQSYPPEKIKPLLKIICTCAYQDYSRNASNVRDCKNCDSTGFIEADVFTTTHSATPPQPVNTIKTKELVAHKDVGEFRKSVKILCKKCNGKGTIPNTCQCRGRGKVLNRQETLVQEIPVFKKCRKCDGRGFSRIKFSTVLECIQTVLPIKKTAAYRDIKPFFEMLVSRCYEEEAQAEYFLSKEI